MDLLEGRMGELAALVGAVGRKRGLRGVGTEGREWTEGADSGSRSSGARAPVRSGSSANAPAGGAAGPRSNLRQDALPKHMRRRAMSYNARRLPLRLRHVRTPHSTLTAHRSRTTTSVHYAFCIVHSDPRA